MQGRHSVEIIVRKAVIESDLNELDGHYLLAGERFRYRKGAILDFWSNTSNTGNCASTAPGLHPCYICCVFNGLNGQRIWIDEYVAFRNFAEVAGSGVCTNWECLLLNRNIV